MDPSRFDRLTKSLGARRSRRQVLAAGAAGVASIPLAQHAHATAQDATPAASPTTETDNPTFLFVQLADGGMWTPNPAEEGTYLLTLTGAASQTLYFSDRPDRIVGTVPTDQFLAGLGFSPFEPPNAAVVVRTPDGERDVLVVELTNPVYSQQFGPDGQDTLTYQVKVLDAYQGEGLQEWVPQADDDQLPQEFSDVSLFIDGCAAAVDCYSRPDTWVTYPGDLVYVGPIPYGPFPRCYNWFNAKCLPCNVSNDYLAELCNDRYPRCHSAGRTCTADTCWGAFC